MRTFASRQCADYVHASYMYMRVQARRAWYVTFAVGRRCLQYPSRDGPAMPQSLTSISIAKKAVVRDQISESSISERVRLCDAHMALPMVCNDIPCDIPERDPPRTYTRTYILCDNRSSIQIICREGCMLIFYMLLSLLLMFNYQWQIQKFTKGGSATGAQNTPESF